MKTFVIAEAGSCHDGDLATAIHLVHTAKDIGADAVKFQYWSNPDRFADRRRADDYREIYRRYQMPREWLDRLRPLALTAGLEFMCTVYLPEDIEVVAPYVSRFKVASFEAGDPEFVRACALYAKPLIVSTGMSTHPDPDIRAERLHCVSAYPTPLDQASLAVIRLEGYGEAYAGYSDHTACIYTGAFAVCAGARILEFHLRDWATSPQNPDYTTALDPLQAQEYVRLVRLAETMLGDGAKRPMPAEAAMMRYRVKP